jgi:actin-related protein
MEYQPVPLGPELYLACEDIYLNMDLPNMVKQAVHSLDGSTCKKLLSNILLTGGNCRLNGLALRLTKDLQQVKL